jgi:hypothetical protein
MKGNAGSARALQFMKIGSSTSEIGSGEILVHRNIFVCLQENEFLPLGRLNGLFDLCPHSGDSFGGHGFSLPFQLYLCVVIFDLQLR